MEQELVTLSEHLSSPSVFSGVSVTKYLILCCGLQIFVCHFVLYLFAIAVSLVFCVVVCRSLFVISSFIFLPLQCLQFCVVVCRSLFVILFFIFLSLQCLQFFVLWFVDLCLSFCPLSFCHCSVFSFVQWFVDLCLSVCPLSVCHCSVFSFVLQFVDLCLSFRPLSFCHCSVFSFVCCDLQIFVWHFVLYLFAIVLSVLCITASDSLFGIFKLCLIISHFVQKVSYCS